MAAVIAWTDPLFQLSFHHSKYHFLLYCAAYGHHLHHLNLKIIHLILSESLSNGDGGSYNDGENGQQNEEDAQEEYN